MYVHKIYKSKKNFISNDKMITYENHEKDEHNLFKLSK